MATSRPTRRRTERKRNTKSKRKEKRVGKDAPTPLPGKTQEKKRENKKKIKGTERSPSPKADREAEIGKKNLDRKDHLNRIHPNNPPLRPKPKM